MLKDFRIGVLAYVVTIVALSNALAYALLLTDWYVIPGLLVIALIAVAMLCYRYVTRTNRDLAKFLFALRHHDFNLQVAQSETGGGFKELRSEMEKVLRVSADLKLARESRFQLLQAILNEMPSGVLLVNKNEEIALTNRAFLHYAQTPQCQNLPQLEEHITGIQKILHEVQHGRQSFSIQVAGESHQLLASYIRLKFEEELDLYVIHSAADSLENTELDAWNKLIRILTHEIMNSVTSISSLSATGLEILSEPEQQENLRKAMKAIQRRSNGLLDFVERYRRFTNVAAPQKEWLTIQEELRTVQSLMQTELGGIQIEMKGDEELKVFADKAQFQQVIQNVLLNAAHALGKTENPQIQINWFSEGSFKKVLIRDNGMGISPEQLNDVFIPFFTTRETGSGIGLSLVRQIMQKHRGGASIASEQGSFTEISLRFPEN